MVRGREMERWVWLRFAVRFEVVDVVKGRGGFP